MWRHLFILALILAFTPQRLSALIFGPDDRIAVSSQEDSVYGPIGVIFGGSVSGHATAFLINDCHILTVRHAFGHKARIVGARTIFAAGAAGHSRNWSTTGAKVIDAGEPARGASNSSGDWALLKLTKCLGKRYGSALLTDQTPSIGHKVQLAGYPIDKAFSAGLILDPDCRVRHIEAQGLVRHDCATQPGNSGSPLFDIIEVGGRKKLRVFAMNSAGHSFGVPGANLHTPVVSFYPAYAGSALAIGNMAIDRLVQLKGHRSRELIVAGPNPAASHSRADHSS